MTHRFWIVGGEYRDTNFREIVAGTQCLNGPFPSYDEALSQWRRIANESRGDACVRYTIAQEATR